nr:M1 family metallopeptidase [Streptomyces cavernae]
MLVLAGCSGGAHGTPGAAGVGDPYFRKLGNGGYDVTHYGLTLSYEPKQRHLVGTAVVTARATRDLSSFHLDFQGLHVNGVTVDGKRARFSRDGQELTVRPRAVLREERTFRATVRYSGTPESITDPDGSQEGWLPTADGALALGEPAGAMAWFPGNNHPSDKARYDITVTVPRGLQAVSNGEPTRESIRDGRTTFVWHVGEPMATYLATVAIGRFETRRSALPGGLPVVTAVDPAEARESASVLDRIPEVMEWAEHNFGPYPFSSVGAIVDPAEEVGYALETQNRPVFTFAPDLSTLVHELAHQWYGNSVTPDSWRDMWLNESFATYAEWLWEEDHGGPSARQTFDELYDGDYFDDEEQSEDVWAFPPAKPPSAARISDIPVYYGGAMVLHKIRETVGDDRFYAIIQGWAKAHRHGNADTAAFTAYVEDMAPGEDFDGIWRDWLYGEGKPAER